MCFRFAELKECELRRLCQAGVAGGGSSERRGSHTGDSTGLRQGISREWGRSRGRRRDDEDDTLHTLQKQWGMGPEDRISGLCGVSTV